MRIAIEALGIHYFGGGRTATLSLFEPLFSLDTENEYLIFLSQPEPSLETQSGNVHQYIVPIKNRFLLRLWAQLFIPWLTRTHDLVHFAKNLGVFGVRPPYLVTIYDMTTLVHPELLPAFDVWYWKHVEKQTLKNAACTIAISKVTAADIGHYYAIKEGSIRIIYPAYSNLFHIATPLEIASVRNKYQLPEKYLIHVGRIDRKKNLTTLVRAFAQFRMMTKTDIKLVLVGEDYQKSRDINLHPTIKDLGLTDQVIFTGRVPDLDLPSLYSGAFLAVFPSIHEGFGLAPIEAMACGVPVIANEAGALREATGDAAWLLPSLTVDSISEAIRRLTQDAGLRAELRQRGLARSDLFRGENTARETLSLYREIVSRERKG
jgi:glycosyltransferase involved in cell wall biosynthesis